MGIGEKKRKGARGKILFSPFPLFVFFSLSFILPARASYVSELKFQESLKAFKSGDYREAMLGFMDVVVAEPENDLARNYLNEAGRRVLGMEDKNTQLRRQNLLRDAETMKNRLASLEVSKKARVREWDDLFSRANDLAGSADSLREAVAAYEAFILKTPAYAELRGEFSRKEKIIWRTFYKTIKDRYPEMVSGRTRIDEADLGGVFFAREALNDSSYRYTDTRQTESMLAKSSRLKHLRGGVIALLDDETHALDLYSRGKFAEAEALFGKVMKGGTGNEEAVFYSELAEERLAAALPPPAVKTAKTAAVTSAPAKLAGASAKLPGNGARKPRPPRSAGEGSGPSAGPLDGRPAPAAAVKPARPARGRKRPADKPAAAAPLTGAGAAVPSPKPAAEGRQGGTEADKLYERGVREFSVGNYAGADKSWDECLRLDPGHAKARLGLERLKSSGVGAS